MDKMPGSKQDEESPNLSQWMNTARTCKDPLAWLDGLLALQDHDAVSAEAALEAILQNHDSLEREEFLRCLMLQDQLARFSLSELRLSESSLRRGALEPYFRNPEFLLGMSSRGALQHFLLWARHNLGPEMLDGMLEEDPSGDLLRNIVLGFLIDQPGETVMSDVEFEKFSVRHSVKVMDCEQEDYDCVRQGKNKKDENAPHWLYSDYAENKRGHCRARIYLNPHPDFLIEVFRSIHDRLRLWSIPHAIKVIVNPGPENLVASDLVVVYTSPTFHRKLRPALNGTLRDIRDVLRPETPKFAMPWRTGPNFEMVQGVAIAAEPRVDAEILKDAGIKRSFNQVTSSILRDLVLIAKEERYHVSDRAFPVEDVFDELCRHYGLNPKIPALNTDDSVEDYYRLVTGQ